MVVGRGLTSFDRFTNRFFILSSRLFAFEDKSVIKQVVRSE